MLGDYKIEFEKISYAAGKNFLARQGNFKLSKNGKDLGELQPQLRFYPVNDQTTNEASFQYTLQPPFNNYYGFQLFFPYLRMKLGYQSILEYSHAKHRYQYLLHL